MSINKIIISGNLGRDVEVRTTQSGKRVGTLSVVTDDGYTDSDSGEWKARKNWHKVVTWSDGLIDSLERNAVKGRLVTVVGTLEANSYRKDGEDSDRTSYEIVVGRNGEIDFPTPPPASSAS